MRNSYMYVDGHLKNLKCKMFLCMVFHFIEKKFAVTPSSKKKEPRLIKLSKNFILIHFI